MALLQLIAGILTGTAGPQIGAAVSWVGQLTALAAIFAPVFLWLSANRHEQAITITFGDLAFWGSIIGVFVLFALRLVHRAPPP
jgi:hypothetical protein